MLFLSASFEPRSFTCRMIRESRPAMAKARPSATFDISMPKGSGLKNRNAAIMKPTRKSV